jgi:hypothetical protein
MMGTVNFDGVLRTAAFTAIEVGGGGGVAVAEAAEPPAWSAGGYPES